MRNTDRNEIARGHIWELLALGSLCMLLRFQRIGPIVFLLVLLLWSIDLIRRNGRRARSNETRRSNSEPTTA